MQLTKPSPEYLNSYIESFYEDNKDLCSIGLLKSDVIANPQLVIEKAQSDEAGKNLKLGYVPQTVYWGIVDGKYVGNIRLRHSLTDELTRVGGHIGYEVRPSEREKGYGTEMLKLILPKAKEFGLTKVLITCDSTNTGSKKIIESNGGIIEDEVFSEEGKPSILRYWIDLN